MYFSGSEEAIHPILLVGTTLCDMLVWIKLPKINSLPRYYLISVLLTEVTIIYQSLSLLLEGLYNVGFYYVFNVQYC